MNLRAFPEHLQLNPPSTIRHKIVGPDQSFRYLLCFSSRCKDLIKAYISEVKKSYMENFIAYWEESEQNKALANKCGSSQK